MKNKIKAFFIILWQGIIMRIFALSLFVLVVICSAAVVIPCIEWLIDFTLSKGNYVIILTQIIIVVEVLSIFIMGVGAFIKYIHNTLIPAYNKVLERLNNKYKEKQTNEK